MSLCLISCDSKSRQLKEIDNIIESDPQGALAALEKINSANLSSSDYPYYSLLYTQAQIKNHIIVSSDSLIKIAYERYGRESSGDLKKRACFYNAKVSYNKREFQLAMKDVLVAYDIAKSENDPYWIAKSAELMGDIFSETYNYKQTELYTIETAEYYKKANRIANHRYALCDLASVYLDENRNDEAMFLLDSLSNVVKSEYPLDTSLINYINMPTYSALLNTNQLDKLEDITYHYIYTPTKREVIDFSIMNSYLLNAKGDTDGAYLILSEANKLADNEPQHAQIMYASYQHALSAGNYQKAAIMADSLLLQQSRIAESLLRESVTGVQRDFYSSKAYQHEQKSKFILYILIAVISASVIITTLLILMYKLKIRAKKAELETNISSLMFFKKQAEHTGTENQRLSKELSDKSVVLDGLQQKLEVKSQREVHNRAVIEHLFKEKWGTLNMLCNEYFETGEAENTRTVTLNRIENELQKLRTKKNLKEIENAVDTYMGNIMSLLREECPFLKEDDFIFLSLIFAGLSVRAVCLFTGMKYKLFYLKRSRLSKRISISDAPHKDLFIKKLSNRQKYSDIRPEN